MLTCQIFLSYCRIFMLTCQILMLTNEWFIYKKKYSSTLLIFFLSMIWYNIHMLWYATLILCYICKNKYIIGYGMVWYWIYGSFPFFNRREYFWRLIVWFTGKICLWNRLVICFPLKFCVLLDDKCESVDMFFFCGKQHLHFVRISDYRQILKIIII